MKCMDPPHAVYACFLTFGWPHHSGLCSPMSGARGSVLLSYRLTVSLPHGLAQVTSWRRARATGTADSDNKSYLAPPQRNVLPVWATRVALRSLTVSMSDNVLAQVMSWRRARATAKHRPRRTCSCWCSGSSATRPMRYFKT